MGGPKTGVPHTRWEVAFWICAFAAPVVALATARSTTDVLLWGGLLLLTLWGVISSWRLHRSRPDILAQKAPGWVLCVLGLAAVLFFLLAASEPRLADKVVLGLMGLSGVLVVVVEQTRQVPKDAVVTGKTGGYFDPMTAAGRYHRQRAMEIVVLIGTVAAVIAGIAGARVGFFLAFQGLIVLTTVEVIVWFQRRRSRKPQADQESSPGGS